MPANLISSLFVFQVNIKRPSKQSNWCICLFDLTGFSFGFSTQAHAHVQNVCRRRGRSAAVSRTCLCTKANINGRCEMTWGTYRLLRTASLDSAWCLAHFLCTSKIKEYPKQVQYTKLWVFKAGFKYMCTAYLRIFLLFQAETHIWSAWMNFVKGSHRM